MTEPPSKRVRRTDAKQMWDENPTSKSHKQEITKQSKSARQDPSNQTSRRQHSRSRSPSRERKKGRDRDDRDRKGGRDRDRERDRDRGERDSRRDRDDGRGVMKRNRSRSPPSRASPSVRQRSPPRGPRKDRSRSRERCDGKTNGIAAQTNGRGKDVKMENGIDPDDDSDTAMMKAMGFGAFKSTKNTKVPGNDRNYGVRKEKKTEYRQYMNRQGGFNRPLSPG